jgi:hypothetical protein
MIHSDQLNRADQDIVAHNAHISSHAGTAD